MAEDTKKLDAERDSRRKTQDARPESAGTPDEDDSLNEEVDEEAEEERRLKPATPSVPISELRKVRAEAAKYRKQLRQLESKIGEERKASELAKMEETDRLKAIAAEAEAKAKTLNVRLEAVMKRSAVISAASALGFLNPTDAASLIDYGQIEVNDDGTLADEEKLSELVKSLAESKPYLIREDSDAGARSLPGDFGPTNPPSGNWPRPKLRTKDQIDRLKQQSSEAMQSGRVTEAIKLYNRAWEMERGVKKK